MNTWGTHAGGLGWGGEGATPREKKRQSQSVAGWLGGCLYGDPLDDLSVLPHALLDHAVLTLVPTYTHARTRTVRGVYVVT